MIHEIRADDQYAARKDQRQMGLDIFADQPPFIAEDIARADQNRTPKIGADKSSQEKFTYQATLGKL